MNTRKKIDLIKVDNLGEVTESNSEIRIKNYNHEVVKIFERIKFSPWITQDKITSVVLENIIHALRGDDIELIDIKEENNTSYILNQEFTEITDIEITDGKQIYDKEINNYDNDDFFKKEDIIINNIDSDLIEM